MLSPTYDLPGSTPGGIHASVPWGRTLSRKAGFVTCRGSTFGSGQDIMTKAVHMVSLSIMAISSNLGLRAYMALLAADGAWDQGRKITTS